MKDSLRNALWPLVLALSVLVCVFAIHPYADWSYGDDFAYAKPVEQFLQSGEMHYTDWSSMTLVLQVWVGAFFCKIFGFSFNTLRAVSVLFECSAVLALYFCAVSLRAHRSLSVFAALVLLFHPLFFEHALTFGTDVPFLGVALWSFYFFLRFLETEKLVHYVLGTVLCIASFLIRDVALIIAPAFAIAYLLKRGITTRSIAFASVTVVSLLMSYAVWRWWLIHFHGLPKNIDFSRQRLLETFSNPLLLIRSYGRNLVYTLCYVGMALLPLSLLAMRELRRNLRPAHVVLSIIATGALSLVVIQTQVLKDNASIQIFNPFILFTPQENVYALNSASIPVVQDWLKDVVLVLSIASMVTLLHFVFRELYRTRNARPWRRFLSEESSLVFLLTSLLLYILGIFSQWMLNRYYLLMIPLAILIILHLARARSVVPSKSLKASLVLVLGVYSYFSLSAGHDLLAYQRASIEAFHYLENDLARQAEEIDGGFNYNARRSFDFHFKPRQDHNWWWVHSARYVVLDGMSDSMRVLKSYSYSRWFPLGMDGQVWVLENLRKDP